MPQRSIGNQAALRRMARRQTDAFQPKLTVGAVDDPLEHEADRVADQVMRMPDPALLSNPPLSIGWAPPQLSHKCGACEQEDADKLQTKPAAPSAETPRPAPAIAHDVLRAPGRPLDPAARAFFEPRFGNDFADVRVHHDAGAAEAARAVGALAYTVGRDIVFSAGAYAARTDAGRWLLAHELAHTVQQGSAPALQTRLQRKLMVSAPDALIPNPDGKGKVQTNAAAIGSYLTTLCPSGSPSVAPGAGAVAIAPAFCSAPALEPGTAGPPAPSGAQKSATATGCGCICDLVQSPNLWTIKIDDADWPHTNFDDEAKANGTTPGGTGGTVTAPSPNSPKVWGTATKSGAAVNIDPWLVLGHELCGHAWLGNSGKTGPDEAANRGEGGHQETIARENALRAEHGIDLRGSYKDPNCGESFWRDKNVPGTVNWSDFRDVCIQWRDNYNKTNNTKYTINDKIP
jgi:hypothetical protein